MAGGTRQAARLAASRPVPWWLFASVIVAVGIIGLPSLMAHGPGEEGLARVTRYTARFSFLIFVVVFASGALAQLFPSPVTRWLRRNRRYMGLSFALAHFLHLGAIVALFSALGQTPDIVTLVGGGTAYLLIGLMAATSNDWSMRKLGRAWRTLHLVGLFYVWLIFMNSYVSRLLSEEPEAKGISAVTAGLGVLALGLRITAKVRRTGRIADRSHRGGADRHAHITTAGSRGPRGGDCGSGPRPRE